MPRRRRRRRRLLLAAVLPVLAAAGCGGSVDVNGQVGITVTEDGTPVAVVEICHGSVVTLSVAGPNRGQQPNEVHAELTADQPLQASTTVVLAEPGAGWQGTALLPPLDDSLYIVLADDREEHRQLQQADFTPAELAALDPGTVQYSEFVFGADDPLQSVQVPLADFRAIACRARG
jgi:hypothetical protein